MRFWVRVLVKLVTGVIKSTQSLMGCVVLLSHWIMSEGTESASLFARILKYYHINCVGSELKSRSGGLYIDFLPRKVISLCYMIQ